MAPGFNPYAMIAGLGGALAGGYKMGQGIVQDRQRQETLASLGGALGSAGGQFGEAASKLAALGDVQGAVSLLSLEQKQRQSRQQEEAARQFQSLFSGGGQASAPASPAMGGGAIPQIGTPNEVESRFINTVKQAGLTNPYGLAAVAATGKAESSYSPGNVNRTWNDPSESGQPGVAGGVMSWRGPRLQALQAFARQRGEAQPSVETQAMFLAQEDPQLLPRLNAAKSVEEANDIMANAWRFAGFDRPGGERDRRLAIARQYAPRFAPVDVAGSEADVQRLEAQQGAPVQVAQAPQVSASDAPAPGAVPTQGFAIPGGQAQADPAEEGVYIKGVPTQRLIAAKASPGITPQQSSAIDAELRAREARRTEMRGRNRPLVDPAERAQYGIAPNDTRIYQVDGQGKLTSPSGSTVTVNNKSESEYDKTVGKEFAGINVEIIKDARNANGKIATLNRLEQLVGDPRIYTGAGAGAVLQAKRIAKAAGIDVGDLGGEEALRAIGNQFALELRNPAGGAGMPGALSDKDREFLVASVPGLQQTREGNALIIDYSRRMAQRSIEVEKLRREYVKQNKRLDEGFFDQLAQWSAANPMFSEEEKARIGGAAQATPQGQPSPQPTPVQQQRPQGQNPIAINPQTGETIMFDGRAWVPVQ